MRGGASFFTVPASGPVYRQIHDLRVMEYGVDRALRSHRSRRLRVLEQHGWAEMVAGWRNLVLLRVEPMVSNLSHYTGVAPRLTLREVYEGLEGHAMVDHGCRILGGLAEEVVDHIKSILLGEAAFLG